MIPVVSRGRVLQSLLTGPGPLIVNFSTIYQYSILGQMLHNSSCQDTIASWLCEEMTRDGLELDQLDLGGNTPLHLAARNGNTNTASTLLNLGARVNIKVSSSFISLLYSIFVNYFQNYKILENPSC